MINNGELKIFKPTVLYIQEYLSCCIFVTLCHKYRMSAKLINMPVPRLLYFSFRGFGSVVENHTRCRYLACWLEQKAAWLVSASFGWAECRILARPFSYNRRLRASLSENIPIQNPFIKNILFLNNVVENAENLGLFLLHTHTILFYSRTSMRKKILITFPLSFLRKLPLRLDSGPIIDIWSTRENNNLSLLNIRP